MQGDIEANAGQARTYCWLQGETVTKGYVQKDSVYNDERFAPFQLVDVPLLIVGKSTQMDWHVHNAYSFIFF